VNLFFNGITNQGAISIGINIRPDRIIYAILLIEFIRQYQSEERVSLILEEKLMLLLFVILLLSSIVGGSIWSTQNKYYTRLFGISIVPATFFMVSRRIVHDNRSLKAMWICFFIGGLYLGLTGMCEHYRMDSLIFPKYILDPSVGIHFGRVRGPFVQSAVMGGVMGTLGLLVLWSHFNVRKTWLTWVVFFPMLASIYWTNTRGVWLQIAASMAVLGLFRNPLQRPIWALGLVIVAVYFSGIASKFSAYQTTLFKQRHEQIDDRLNIYHASWRMFAERPLFGFGYANFLEYCEDYFEELDGVELRGQREGQHNTLLGLMSETGAVGTIPFLLIYCLFFKACYQRFRSFESSDSRGKSFALMQLAILAGNAVSMQFSDFNCYTYFNNLTFWLTGIVYARLADANYPVVSDVVEPQDFAQAPAQV
jgi:O-antigen ligase